VHFTTLPQNSWDLLNAFIVQQQLGWRLAGVTHFSLDLRKRQTHHNNRLFEIYNYFLLFPTYKAKLTLCLSCVCVHYSLSGTVNRRRETNHMCENKSLWLWNEGKLHLKLFYYIDILFIRRNILVAFFWFKIITSLHELNDVKLI